MESAEAEVTRELVHELIRASNSLNLDYHRVRLAVTQAEYEDIRKYMLQRDGYFSAQIKGVPLIIEDNPLKPGLKVEYARLD